MSDSFNFANPTEGNNIVRSGTAAFYNNKAHFIPATNLDGSISFPNNTSAPRIIALANGGFLLQGTIDVTGILAVNTRIFDIPVDLGVLPSPTVTRPLTVSTLIQPGEIAAVPRGMILRVNNSSDVNIAAEVRYLGLTTGSTGLTGGDKIFLDFMPLCPNLVVQ